LRRRDFITLVGGAAAAWPLAARAQLAAVPVIGFLNGGTADTYVKPVAGFRQGLVKAGLVEGGDIVIEFRWADGQYSRLATLASDLVNRRVTAIVVGPLTAAFEVKALTTTIPVVFTSGLDPVDTGLVESLNHPGGNLTGIAQLTQALVPTTNAGSRLKWSVCGKVLPYMPAFQPYRGKPAVRNDRGDRGKVGIMRSPIRASILPDCGGRRAISVPTANAGRYRTDPRAPGKL
jgi:hypothetical protein